jgi:hypothetical protein
LAIVRINDVAQDDPAFFAKYRYIEFIFKADHTKIINEPNVMYYVKEYISYLYKFYPIAERVREMKLYFDCEMPIPDQFHNLTHLSTCSDKEYPNHSSNEDIRY